MTRAGMTRAGSGARPDRPGPARRQPRRTPVLRRSTAPAPASAVAPRAAAAVTAENCRPGRIRRDQAHHLLAAELLLDRRLRTGDTQLLGYGFDDAPSADPSCEYVRGFNAGAGQYVLQIAFHPAALPVRCHRFALRSPGDAPYETEELTLDGHHCVHLVATALRPCLLGIRWDWE
ncbi:hypothetical protein ACIRRH_04155 [Kitasatospora sp. NPDC101235]|uniref:hypothetical protein n=1 Tax=Kitasatospora sp. NPDC101235 TaxID=3364101 RepID=UPI00380F1025